MIITSSVAYSANPTREAGREFAGTIISDSSSNKRGGVIVFHGGAGVGAHEIERARRLAELGYVAFVPDLFGEKFESRAQGMAVIGALVAEPSALRARVNAALSFLRAHRNVDAARTAAIGFCFGGLAALELARSGADVRAVVTFHGGLTTRAPASRDGVRAKILVSTGVADPFVTRAHRASFEDEMTTANADWDLLLLGRAMHGFTEGASDPPRHGCAYDEVADRQSWLAMRRVFEDTMG